MKQSIIILVSLLAAALTFSACGRGAKSDPAPEPMAPPSTQTTTQPTAPPQPTVPMCGSYVVIMEEPTSTGTLNAGRIQSALIAGLREGGCHVHTTRPARIPGGTVVLTLSPRIQPMGSSGHNLEVRATNTSTGNLQLRDQARISSGDGSAEARQLGGRMASNLQ